MRSVFLTFIVFNFLLLFPYSASLRGESVKGCGTECHKNPKFKKEDKKKLQECIVCHSPSVHKGEQGKGSGEKLNLDGRGGEIAPSNMVYIPEGEFIMGTDDRLKDEKPAHVVYTEAFYIDVYEVTNSDYKKFVDHVDYPTPDHWENGTFPEGKDQHPVVHVSWYDADNYCKWAGKRLPREREWEKAARGTDGRTYPWGNVWAMDKSNHPLLEIGDTQQVGSYEQGKSPYGLYDMSGNVWEWVDDYYNPHPGSDYINPEFGDKYRLLKGGSWWDCSFYACGISAPTFNRAFFEPSVKSESYGFRCAKNG